MKLFRRIGFDMSRIILHTAHLGRYAILRWCGGREQMHGVRIILERDGRVVLVRHWFAPGVWTLPGGAVEVGESSEAAAAREAREETGFIVNSFQGELGVYEGRLGKHDVVQVLFSNDFEGSLKFVPNGEIMQRGLFAFDNLPETLSPANRRRIEAYRAGVKNERGYW